MERTVTFTFEDALISPLGFAILSGAGLIDATVGKPITVHSTARLEAVVTGTGTLTLDVDLSAAGTIATGTNAPIYGYLIDSSGALGAKLDNPVLSGSTVSFDKPATGTYVAGDKVLVMVDFYKEMTSGATQLEITPDKFAGYYYLEASTLFRRQDTGADMAAEFVIPNAKIQSSFNFSMASSGDPSKVMCLAA